MISSIAITVLLLLAGTSTVATYSIPAQASTGMSDCNNGAEEDSEDCGRQADRVGNDEEGDEDADRDGPDEQEDANCWGKVTSDFTTTKDGDGGGDMSHASDPVRGDDDNETPREGVGNQNEGHPSDHGDTVGPQFGSDEACTQD
jgi:hypothetical protein